MAGLEVHVPASLNWNRKALRASRMSPVPMLRLDPREGAPPVTTRFAEKHKSSPYQSKTEAFEAPVIVVVVSAVDMIIR